jgi:hypothetical protein
MAKRKLFDEMMEGVEWREVEPYPIAAAEPQAPEELLLLLSGLRKQRRERHRERRKLPLPPRTPLSQAERETVLLKSGRCCHICGGEILDGERWQADHVRPHSAGGLHDLNNYLPAHKLCNTYRWDHDPEEIKWILKIGVWSRKQMEKRSKLGRELRAAFYKKELRRQQRRKPRT